MAELAVWVNGREKRVTGVARSTTCRDVVAVLLRDHLGASAVPLAGYSRCFSLFERWRGCERALSPRTRLYKLWQAWGDEQPSVRFTLKRSTSGQPHPEEIGDELIGQAGSGRAGGGAPVSAESTADKKVRNSTVRPLRVRAKDRSHHHHRRRSAETVRNRHRDRQAESAGRRDRSEPAQDLDSLVRTVVKRSKRLQELLDTVREIDVEIEFYETKAHLLRVEERGRNYVQDAYLSRVGGDTSQSEDTDDYRCEPAANGCSDLEAYISSYENLLDVESDLAAKRCAVAALTEKLERAGLPCTGEPAAVGSDVRRDGKRGTMTNDERAERDEIPLSTDDEKHRADYQREIGLVRAQLEWYTDVCVAQKSEIATMQNRLASAEALYNDKHHWLDILVRELDRLERSSPLDATRDVGEVAAQPDSPAPETSTEYREAVDRGESTPDDGHDSGVCLSPYETPKLRTRTGIDNDSSSDTGLSSLHSQEDTEHLPVVAETLV